MDSLAGIGFENYRIFKDRVYFEIKPFTIITGPNNHCGCGLLIADFRISEGGIEIADLIPKSQIRNRPSEIDLPKSEIITVFPPLYPAAGSAPHLPRDPPSPAELLIPVLP